VAAGPLGRQRGSHRGVAGGVTRPSDRPLMQTGDEFVEAVRLLTRGEHA
jgi:hypothetical protein